MEKKPIFGIMLTVILMGVTLPLGIHPAMASGTIYIRGDGSIDPPTAAIHRNADVYTFTDNIYDRISVGKSNILLDGSGFMLQGPGNTTFTQGIDIGGGDRNVTVKNMKITEWGTGVDMSDYERGSFYNTISGNNITNNGFGVLIGPCAVYNTVLLNEISFNIVGISLGHDYSHGNTITENNVSDNIYGIEGFLRSYDNMIYHNNFIDNTEQVYSRWGELDGPQIWDNGYPSGGNYWSDYTGLDVYSGPDQNAIGGDGIGDTPYLVSVNHDYRPYVDIDHYPLMSPWIPNPPIIVVALEMDPDNLNLGSKGKWITVYIRLPESYDAVEINASTILLNGTISPVMDSKYSFVANSSEYLVDRNNDWILERMVKFNRTAVEDYLISEGYVHGNITLAVTGLLCDGTKFESDSRVLVKMPGDVDGDGIIDARDLGMVGKTFGTKAGSVLYDRNVDFDSDGTINAYELATVGINFGKRYP